MANKFLQYFHTATILVIISTSGSDVRARLAITVVDGFNFAIGQNFCHLSSFLLSSPCFPATIETILENISPGNEEKIFESEHDNVVTVFITRPLRDIIISLDSH